MVLEFLFSKKNLIFQNLQEKQEELQLTLKVMIAMQNKIKFKNNKKNKLKLM